MKRSDAVTSILGIALLAMIILFSALVFSVLGNQADSEEAGRRDSCVASLTADYFVAIKRALSAPPAPNPERLAATNDLNITAERIRDRVKICEDGRPDDYQPQPPVESTIP